MSFSCRCINEHRSRLSCAHQQETSQSRNPDYVLTPLIIDDNPVITCKNLLPLPLPCQTILRKGNSWVPIATNQEHLLICQSSKLCLLNTNKEIPWPYDQIWDMFFSATLDRFIIITEHKIFTFNNKTMALTKYFIPHHETWYCGTSHNETLFLSTLDKSSTIYEYKMLPFIQFVRKWEPPLLCATDELIYDLRSNESFLALIISNQIKEETRLELRSPMTFQQQWTLSITSASQVYRIRCSPLSYGQWLITDPINSRLLHIGNDGIVIKQYEYNPSPRHIVQLDNQLIAVSTRESINIHRLFLD